MLAKCTERIDGCLMGGTALAVHLRHRISFDLDYMAEGDFSGDLLAEGLRREADDFDLVAGGRNQMHAQVNGVKVEVFKAPHRGENPGHVKALQPPLAVDGMPVASLPDLLASKLDVILYRPRLRDYIDLWRMDRDGPYTLEDGLRFHMGRYGTTTQSRDIASIVGLIEDPGTLVADPAFGHLQDEALGHLAARAYDLEQFLNQMRTEGVDSSSHKPPDRTTAGLTPRVWPHRASARLTLPPPTRDR